MQPDSRVELAVTRPISFSIGSWGRVAAVRVTKQQFSRAVSFFVEFETQASHILISRVSDCLSCLGVSVSVWSLVCGVAVSTAQRPGRWHAELARRHGSSDDRQRLLGCSARVVRSRRGRGCGRHRWGGSGWNRVSGRWTGSSIRAHGRADRPTIRSMKKQERRKTDVPGAASCATRPRQY
eukprot:COSAG02_NODE_1483_length_12385_cov_116.196565_5_plen_181_part_00